MSKRNYTLLEYLVALENSMKELKKYVDNYNGIELGNIDEKIDDIKNQNNELKEEFNNTKTEINSQLKTINTKIESGEISGEVDIKNFYKQPKNGKKIVLAGDSTTNSGGMIDLRLKKHEELENCTIVNKGINGFTLSKLIDGTGVITLDGLINEKADLYVFCYGINDFNINTSLTVSDFYELMKIAIDRLLNETNSYILLRIPNTTLTGQANAQINTNNLYEAYNMFKDYNKRVDILDIQSLVFGRECKAEHLLMADALHPNEYGYNSIADEIVFRICGYNDREGIRFNLKSINGNEIKLLNTKLYNDIEINTIYIKNKSTCVLKTIVVNNEITIITKDNIGDETIGVVECTVIEPCLLTANNSNYRDWYNYKDDTYARSYFIFRVDTSTLNINKNNIIELSYSYKSYKDINLTVAPQILFSNDANNMWGGINKKCSYDTVKYNNISTHNYTINLNSEANYNYMFLMFNFEKTVPLDLDLGNIKLSINGLSIDLDSSYHDDKLTKTNSPVLMTEKSVYEILEKLGLLNGTPNYTPVESLMINENSITLKQTKTQQLTKNILPDSATNKQVKWTSDNNSIATVDNEGVVTGISIGSCKITCRSLSNSDVYDECDVSVIENTLTTFATLRDFTASNCEIEYTNDNNATLTSDKAWAKIAITSKNITPQTNYRVSFEIEDIEGNYIKNVFMLMPKYKSITLTKNGNTYISEFNTEDNDSIYNFEICISNVDGQRSCKIKNFIFTEV